MNRRQVLAGAARVAAAALLCCLPFLAIACRGETEPGPAHATPGSSPSPTVTITATATAPPMNYPSEFRVAFINLLSPLTVDANDTEAGETFDDRLTVIIEELKAFDPDVVGFNEASRTAQYGDAIARLTRELKMEPYYVRANPRFPGLRPEEQDELVKRAGFEEGELILVRGSRYPVLRADSRILNPRTSESGEVRVGWHVVVKGPPSVGDIDVYITHLTGGGNRIRQAQAVDFAAWIKSTRGVGPAIVMVGNSDPATGDLYQFFKPLGLVDVGGDDPIATCCRESVVGEQPPLTVRVDLLMTLGWEPLSYQLIGSTPAVRPDGTVLYASDHDGLAAILPIPPMPHLPP
jgi:hypothetical protein